MSLYRNNEFILLYNKINLVFNLINVFCFYTSKSCTNEQMNTTFASGLFALIIHNPPHNKLVDFSWICYTKVKLHPCCSLLTEGIP